MGKISKVRKKDGTLTPFDAKEIVQLIYQASVTAGIPDYEFSEELADIVVFFLERTFTDSYPSSDDIYEWIERVLLETADPEITRAFILRREEKGNQELNNAKFAKEPSLFEEFEIKVVNSDNAISFWNRRKIAESLNFETGISSKVAEEIAAKVESKIFSLGISKVTTSLIRALVDTELIDLGLFETLKDYEPAIIPFSDFENILLRGRFQDNQPPLLVPSDLTAHIAKVFYKQFSSKKIYTPAVIEGFQAGQIYPLAIDNPFKLQRIVCTTEILKEGISDISLELSSTNIDKFITELSRYIEILFESAHQVELQGLTWSLAPIFDGLSQDLVASCWRRILLMLSKFQNKKLFVEINYKAPTLVEKLAAKPLNADSELSGKTFSDYNDCIQNLANLTFDSMLKNEIPRNSPVFIFTFSWDDIFKPSNYKILEKCCLCASEFANPIFRIDSDKIKGMLASSSKALKGIFASVSINLVPAAYLANFDEDDFIEHVESFISKAVQALNEHRAYLLNYYNRFQLSRSKTPNNQHLIKLEDFEGEIRLCGLTAAIMYLYNEKNRWGLNKIRKQLATQTLNLFENTSPKYDSVGKAAVKFLSYIVFRLKEEQAKLNFKIALTSESDYKITQHFWNLDSKNWTGEIEFFAFNNLLQTYPLGFKILDEKQDARQKITEEARIASILDGKNITINSQLPKYAPDEILNIFKLVFTVKGASELAFSVPTLLCLSCGHLNNFVFKNDATCQKCSSSILQQGEINSGSFIPKEIKTSETHKNSGNDDAQIEIITS